MTVTEKAGLHARPAALFVQTASRFQAEVTVARAERTADPAAPPAAGRGDAGGPGGAADGGEPGGAPAGGGRQVSARSVLALMGLNVRCGDEIVLRAHGADGAEALDALAAIAAPDPE